MQCYEMRWVDSLKVEFHFFPLVNLQFFFILAFNKTGNLGYKIWITFYIVHTAHLQIEKIPSGLNLEILIHGI